MVKKILYLIIASFILFGCSGGGSKNYNKEVIQKDLEIKWTDFINKAKNGDITNKDLQLLGIKDNLSTKELAALNTYLDKTPPKNIKELKELINKAIEDSKTLIKIVEHIKDNNITNDDLNYLDINISSELTPTNIKAIKEELENNSSVNTIKDLTYIIEKTKQEVKNVNSIVQKAKEGNLTKDDLSTVLDTNNLLDDNITINTIKEEVAKINKPITPKELNEIINKAQNDAKKVKNILEKTNNGNLSKEDLATLNIKVDSDEIKVITQELNNTKVNNTKETILTPNDLKEQILTIQNELKAVNEIVNKLSEQKSINLKDLQDAGVKEDINNTLLDAINESLIDKKPIKTPSDLKKAIESIKNELNNLNNLYQKAKNGKFDLNDIKKVGIDIDDNNLIKALNKAVDIIKITPKTPKKFKQFIMQVDKAKNYALNMLESINILQKSKLIVSLKDECNNQKININATVKKLYINIPYINKYADDIEIDDFTTTAFLNKESIINYDKNISIKFGWNSQILTYGKGDIKAYIEFSKDITLKQLPLNSSNLLVTEVVVPSNSTNLVSSCKVYASSAVADIKYGLADNDNNTTTHMFLYLPIINKKTARVWLNNNLGANYSNVNNKVFNPAKMASNLNDINAMGSLFQWGRASDGHELIIRNEDINSLYGISEVRSNIPNFAEFIITPDKPYDWRVDINNKLWNNGNKICPQGFRVPTIKEWEEEINSWSSDINHSFTDAQDAINSKLRLSFAGKRRGKDGSFNINYGYYWSSNAKDRNASVILITDDKVYTNVILNKSDGASVRCIKNN